MTPTARAASPLALFESGAILMYLAEKTGQFPPTDPAQRYTTLQWLMWQMGGLGPMLGNWAFFHKFAGKDFEDKRPARPLCERGRAPLGGAGSALEPPALDGGRCLHHCRHGHLPWVRNLIGFYEAADVVGWSDFPHVARALAAFLARPAVQRGLEVPRA